MIHLRQIWVRLLSWTLCSSIAWAVLSTWTDSFLLVNHSPIEHLKDHNSLGTSSKRQLFQGVQPTEGDLLLQKNSLSVILQVGWCQIYSLLLMATWYADTDLLRPMPSYANRNIFVQGCQEMRLFLRICISPAWVGVCFSNYPWRCTCC